MDTQADRSWRLDVAVGALLVLVGTAIPIAVVNLVGFLVPLLMADSLDAVAMWKEVSTWAGTIYVVFAVPLLVGLWKATPDAAMASDAQPRWARDSLRFAAVAYALALSTHVVSRFFFAKEELTALSWIMHALWWIFVLLGLEYIRRFFVFLAKGSEATRTRVVAAAFVVLTAILTGAPYAVSPADIESQWRMAYLVVTLSIGLLVFALLTATLLVFRKALLSTD